MKSDEDGYFTVSRNFSFDKIISQGEISPIYHMKSDEDGYFTVSRNFSFDKIISQGELLQVII